MKFLKKYLAGLIVALGIGSAMALNFDWTSFMKVGEPVAQPQTAFFSGGCVANAIGACSSTGKYWSGTQIMTVLSSGVQVFVPLKDAAGNNYSTGAGTNYRTKTGANIYNNNTGNVGIGTTTPTQALDVSGNVQAKRVILPDTDNATNAGYFSNVSPSSFGGPIISFQPVNNNKYTSFYIYSSGAATIPSQASLGATDNQAIIAMQVERVDANGQVVGTNVVPTFATVGTAYPIRRGNRSSNTAFTEYMRITTGGAVGIGTTTPSVKLEVYHAGSESIQMTTTGTATTAGVYARNTNAGSYVGFSIFGSTFAGQSSAIARAGLAERSSNGNTALLFRNISDTKMYFANNDAVKMTLDNGGKLGLGNTAPGTMLDIWSSSRTAGENYVRNTTFNNDGDPPYWISRQSRGTQAAPTSVLSGDSIGGFLFQGNYGTTANGTWKYGAGIFPVSQGAATTDGIPMGLRFALSDGTSLKDRMWIMSNGNVGIGDTNPNYKLSVITTAKLGLRVEGTGSDIANPLLNFNDKTNGVDAIMGVNGANGMVGTYSNHNFQIITNKNTTPVATFTTGGNIGVGTTVPTAKLHLQSEAGSDFLVEQANDTNTFYPYWLIRRARGTIASKTIVQNASTLGRLFFQAYDGGAYRNAAGIMAEVDGAPAASDMPGRLMFFTTPDGTATEVERMRINNAGTMLLGTTTSLGLPGTTFESNQDGASFNYQFISQHSTDATYYPTYYLIKGRGTKASPTATASGDTIGILAWGHQYDSTLAHVAQSANITTVAMAGITNTIHQASDMFFTTNDGSALVERMRITAAGNVGIGIKAPYYSFHTNTDGVNGLNMYSNFNANAASRPGLYLLRGRGTQASPTAALSGDILGQISFAGQINTTPTAAGFDVGAKIDAYATENYSATTLGTDLRFYTTANTTATNAERMRITNAGNIGIGTTTPEALLQLRSPGPSLSFATTGFSHNFTSTAYSKSNQNAFVSYYSSAAGGAIFGGISNLAAVPGLTFFGISDIAVGTPLTSAPNTFVSFKRNVGNPAALDTYDPAFDFSNGTVGRVPVSPPLMRILGGGAVGMGTATPYAYAGTRLHTNVDGANLNLNLFTQYSTDTTNSPSFYFAKGGGTQASPLVVQTGYILGDLSFAGQYTTAVNAVTRTAVIRGLAEGTYSATSAPSSLQFFTTPIGSATPVVNMMLTKDGNLGIGNTGATVKLVVGNPIVPYGAYAPGATAPSVAIGGAGSARIFLAGTDNTSFLFADGGAATNQKMIGITFDGGIMKFQSYLDAGGNFNQNIISLNATGSVGMGTTPVAANILTIQGAGSTSATNSISATDSGGVVKFRVGDNGYIGLGGDVSATNFFQASVPSTNAPVTANFLNPSGGSSASIRVGMTNSDGYVGGMQLFGAGGAGTFISRLQFGTVLNKPTTFIQSGVVRMFMPVGGGTYIGDYLAGNYTSFDNNGFMTSAGSGLARDDLMIVMTDTDVVAQRPVLEVLNGSTIKGRCFDGGSQMNEMFGSVEIAHGIYLGTGAEFEIHAHWMGDATSATTTGVWYMEYSKLSLNQVMSASTVVSGSYYGITGRQYRLDDIATTNISLSGYNIGDTIVFRIYRDPTGADTYAGNMCLIQAGFHTRFDSIGSRTEYAK